LPDYRRSVNRRGGKIPNSQGRGARQSHAGVMERAGRR